jgi:hypothetical protein
MELTKFVQFVVNRFIAVIASREKPNQENVPMQLNVQKMFYPYIVGYCQLFNFSGKETNKRINQAFRDKAPKNAVLYDPNIKRWRVIHEFPANDDTMLSIIRRNVLKG